MWPIGRALIDSFALTQNVDSCYPPCSAHQALSPGAKGEAGGEDEAVQRSGASIDKIGGLLTDLTKTLQGRELREAPANQLQLTEAAKQKRLELLGQFLAAKIVLTDDQLLEVLNPHAIVVVTGFPVHTSGVGGYCETLLNPSGTAFAASMVPMKRWIEDMKLRGKDIHS